MLFLNNPLLRGLKLLRVLPVLIPNRYGELLRHFLKLFPCHALIKFYIEFRLDIRGAALLVCEGRGLYDKFKLDPDVI